MGGRTTHGEIKARCDCGNIILNWCVCDSKDSEDGKYNDSKDCDSNESVDDFAKADDVDIWSVLDWLDSLKSVQADFCGHKLRYYLHRLPFDHPFKRDGRQVPADEIVCPDDIDYWDYWRPDVETGTAETISDEIILTYQLEDYYDIWADTEGENVITVKIVLWDSEHLILNWRTSSAYTWLEHDGEGGVDRRSDYTESPEYFIEPDVENSVELFWLLKHLHERSHRLTKENLQKHNNATGSNLSHDRASFSSSHASSKSSGYTDGFNQIKHELNVNLISSYRGDSFLDVLCLDGCELHTSNTLMENGCPARSIHVINHNQNHCKEIRSLGLDINLHEETSTSFLQRLRDENHFLQYSIIYLDYTHPGSWQKDIGIILQGRFGPAIHDPEDIFGIRRKREDPWEEQHMLHRVLAITCPARAPHIESSMDGHMKAEQHNCIMVYGIPLNFSFKFGGLLKLMIIMAQHGLVHESAQVYRSRKTWMWSIRFVINGPAPNSTHGRVLSNNADELLDELHRFVWETIASRVACGKTTTDSVSIRKDELDLITEELCWPYPRLSEVVQRFRSVVS